ncbi:MAG: tRNA (adenosine(37)-N6)-threonylcarbamoyltransferase complex ATPase subunit type 1 TsaE [Deltaproteobacteria bacterium]
MKKRKAVIETASPRQTRQAGARLARHLRPGDCLVLLGGFGVGKTTFVKGLAAGLKVRKPREVASPSFVMLRIYEGRVPLYHFDLYRLKGALEVRHIGWDEFTGGDGVTVIEWPQAAERMLPEASWRIRFSILGEAARRIEAQGPKGRAFRFTASSGRPVS